MGKDKEVRKIGILTGGGDCPGLNAFIRGVTKPARSWYDCIGILDGFEGFVEGKHLSLETKMFQYSFPRGTILGSSNKAIHFTGQLKKTGRSKLLISHKMCYVIIRRWILMQ